MRSSWWRRRWDLNPRTALTAYTLSRGTSYSHLSTSPKVIMHNCLFNSLAFDGREGGIRTHVGLHPNGFQDRPVMTTSVPLVIQNARLILPVKTPIVKWYIKLFLKFLFFIILQSSSADLPGCQSGHHRGYRIFFGSIRLFSRH